MTKTRELDIFIRDATKAGKKLDDIKAALAEAGWDEARINAACANYVPSDFPVAVPRPQTFASPRLFFLNLFFFVLLYLVIYNVIAILFTMLDYYLPDPSGWVQSGYFATHSDSIAEAVQDNLSIIIVSTPLLFVTQRTIAKAMQMTKQAIPRIRLMLVYFTMFVGAVIILANASTFAYFVLRGELTLRFILKVAILTITVFGVYFYYRGELKQDEDNA